jgi:hypothetical protein
VNSPIVDLKTRNNVKFLSVASNSFARRKNVKNSEDEYFSTAFAAGNCIFPSALENVLSGAFHHPSILQLFNRFAGVRFKIDSEIDAALKLEPSNLSYISVPKEFIGRSFGCLFHSLSSVLGVIPIGILRNQSASVSGNVLPYVYTNPVWSLLLLETDFVYVLASKSAFSA